MIIWHSNRLVLSVPDEGYSRNTSRALSLIFTCLFVLGPEIFLLIMVLILRTIIKYLSCQPAAIAKKSIGIIHNLFIYCLH